jgi:hypothetical protein
MVNKKLHHMELITNVAFNVLITVWYVLSTYIYIIRGHAVA